MTIPQADASLVLPIWRGRRGLVWTIVLGVLALICGSALAVFAERGGVVPGCKKYALAHGWQYVSYHTNVTNFRTSAICTFTGPAGTEDINLLNISVLTNIWISFAVTLYITVPAFLILFAVLRTWLWRRTAATRAG